MELRFSSRKRLLLVLLVVGAALFFFRDELTALATEAVPTLAPLDLNDTVSVVVHAGFNPSVVKPSRDCPRYAMLETEFSGAGHRFAAFVVAFLFASDANATLMVSSVFWRTPSRHGSYEWMPKFLGWKERDFRPPFFATKTVPNSGLNDAREKLKPCKVTTAARTGHNGFCNGLYCMTNSPWAFKRARPMLLAMRSRVSHSDRRLPKNKVWNAFVVWFADSNNRKERNHLRMAHPTW
jgi:hypothetical protein